MALTDSIKIQITAEVAKALKNMGLVETKTDGMGKKSESLFKKMRGGWIAVAGTVVGVTLALTKAIRMASDFNEQNAKFGTTFGTVIKEANRMRRELVDAYGVSTKAATELLANTGDLLSGFGFTGEAALDLSGKVNKLAIDLASFTNAQGGAEAVSAALTKSLLGEREALKTYGIAILETDVKNRLLEKGQQRLTGMALRQARAVATLELAYEQSKNAIGDFERTSTSFANTMRQIKARADDVTVAIGQKMITAITPTLAEFNKFIKSAEGIKVIETAFDAVIITVITLAAVAKIAFTAMISSAKTLAKVLTGDFIGAFKTQKDAYIDIGKTAVETYTKIKDTVSDTKTSVIDDADAMLQAQLAAQQAAKEAEELATAEKIKIRKATYAAGVNLLNEGFNLQKALLDREVELFSQAQNKKIKAVEDEAADEIAVLDKKLKDGLISQEEYDAGLETIETDRDTRIKTLEDELKVRKKEAFEKQKKADVAQAVINAALAVLKTMTSLPFPLNLIPAGLQTIAGGVQVAAIKAQPVPSFAQGGSFLTNGPQMIMVGDNPSGQERVDITPSETTNNNGMTFNGPITVQANDPDEFMAKLEQKYDNTGTRMFPR